MIDAWLSSSAFHRLDEAADRLFQFVRTVIEVDIFSPAKRSKIMAAIRSKNTAPEMAVRRIVHGMGYRYRLHVKELPGQPDLVFPARRKVILVHGCFWHRHKGCRYASMPETRQEFWRDKFAENVARDRRTRSTLRKAGWSIMVVWQCELKRIETLAGRLEKFLHTEVAAS